MRAAYRFLRARAAQMEPLALSFIFLGLIATPIYLRYPLLAPWLGYYAQVNVPMAAATLILLLASKWNRQSLLALCLYLLMLIPMLATDQLAGIRLSHRAASFGNVWMPFLLPLARLSPQTAQKRIGRMLLVYDGFAILLLAIAIVNRLSEPKLLYAFSDWFWDHELYEYEEIRVMLRLMEWEGPRNLYRFYFIWGHTLTNAIFFNGFFILNDIYARAVGKRYPKLLFFAITLAGILLCGAKMALMVLGAYMILTTWGDKRLLALYGALLAGVYLTGGFGAIIRRFRQTSFTSGRFEAMARFFSEGRYPLKMLTGYGGNSTRVPSSYLYEVRAAFEFPPLMLALDYGVLYALCMVGTLVVTTIRRMARAGIVSFLGIGLWCGQIYTYYASSLNGHDAGWILGTGLLIALSCADITRPKTDRMPEEGGQRA